MTQRITHEIVEKAIEEFLSSGGEIRPGETLGEELLAEPSAKISLGVDQSGFLRLGRMAWELEIRPQTERK